MEEIVLSHKLDFWFLWNIDGIQSIAKQNWNLIVFIEIIRVGRMILKKKIIWIWKI